MGLTGQGELVISCNPTSHKTGKSQWMLADDGRWAERDMAVMATHPAGNEGWIDLGSLPGVGVVVHSKKTAGKRGTQQ